MQNGRYVDDTKDSINAEFDSLERSLKTDSKTLNNNTNSVAGRCAPNLCQAGDFTETKSCFTPTGNKVGRQNTYSCISPPMVASSKGPNPV